MTIAQQLKKAVADLDAMTVQRDAARAEVAKLKADLARATPAAPAVKTATPGQDVVALVDSAKGAEKMRLYKLHKAAYDAAKR